MVSEAVAFRAPEIEPEFLSVAQVARRLGCSVSLVQKWRRLGWLPATRLGPPDVPVYGYRPADVERFVSERWNRQRGRPALGAGAAASPESDPDPAAAGAPGPAGGTSGVAISPGEGGTAPERFKPPRLEPVGAGAGTVSASAAAPAGAGAAETRSASPSAPDAAGVIPVSDDGPLPAQDASPEPVVPPAPPLPPPPPPIKTTGRPLVLWDGDPRTGTAIVIARFPAADAGAALDLATAWARRYNEVFLCEVPRPGAPPGVLAVWNRGQRQELP